MTDPVVDIARLDRSFGSDPPVHALRQVDLRVERGEWLAITGPSGSGKSTLLNIIGLLDTPSGGDYRLEGLDTGVLTDGQRAGLRARRIGFVFQSFHLLTHRSVRENVMLAETYSGRGRRGRAARTEAILDQVGLAPRASFLPSRLSGGERQRVAIARAMLGDPALLLCDEPTGNLDSTSTEAILSLFEDLHARGMTLIVITHEAEVAARAQHRVRIVDGRLGEVA